MGLTEWLERTFGRGVGTDADARDGDGDDRAGADGGPHGGRRDDGHEPQPNAPVPSNGEPEPFRHEETTRLPGAADPARIVEQILDHEPNPHPRGRVIIAHVDRTRATTLVGIVNELEWRLTSPDPVLVGVPHDREALRMAAEAFDTTIAIASNREEYVEPVKEFVPFLFKPDVTTGAIGSVRLIDEFDVSGATPTQGATLGTLREKRGRPLHGQVKTRTPEYYAFAAPGDFHDVVRSAFGERGQIIGGLASGSPQIRVAGWAFVDIETWFGPTRRLGLPLDQTGRPEAATNGDTPPGQATADADPAADATGDDDTEAEPAQPDVGDGPIPQTALHQLDWGRDALDVHTWRNYPGTR